MAWGLFRDDSHRLRLAPSGAATGVDYGRGLTRLMAAGVDTDEAEVLLAACERGMLSALNEKDDDRGTAE